jgi:hypothetical protein
VPLTGEAKLEAQRERRQRQREAPGEAPGHVKPHNEAPDNQGVDGWHTTDKGMRYILQDTGMGGMARRYSPGPRMFSYR